MESRLVTCNTTYYVELMAERAVLLTGIGGQGVQLAAQVIARAAVIDGRQAMLFGSYGGMMRGGNTDATVVVADDAILAPPTVSTAWAGIVMHHDFWEFVRTRMVDGSIVLVNSSVFEGWVEQPSWRTIQVPATDLAIDLGNPMLGTMVMTGVLAAISDLVTAQALDAAVAEALPSYRSKHVAANAAALAAGASWAAANVGVSA